MYRSKLKILSPELLETFTKKASGIDLNKVLKKEATNSKIDYFKFYSSVSTVFSSKIEGVDIDFDSYFKHKFLNVKFKADYTKKADDLFSAYEFIQKHKPNKKNILNAHALLSKHLLPKAQQGSFRKNQMFVINNEGKIEYVAADSSIVSSRMNLLFKDIELLLKSKLNQIEAFYFASMIHLVFVKIHPFNDGNGRTARLLEKWFLLQIIGDKAIYIQSEKNYFDKKAKYYSNIKKLGLEYPDLNYYKSLNFLLMTIKLVL